jgi:hypothetical protein
MCAVIGALLPACGTGATDGDTVNDTAAEASAPGDRAAALDACGAVATAGGPWWNQGFPGQARRFHVEFDATPSTVGLDAVIGLSDGAATGFTGLAAIVRFNASGTIDVRDGDTYHASSSISYSAGTTYHIRIDLDVRTHRYSVFVRFGSYLGIARDYLFRTEQAGVTQLNDIASKVDGATGSVAICGLSVVADATTADGCVVASAGDGFITQPVRDATVVGTVTFNATPSAPGIDGVIGWSAGEPSKFSDLAAAVRFAPSSVIDARDGDTYRADFNQTYSTRGAGFRMTSDLTSHTYSVFLGSSEAAKLARQYRFRPSQAAATHLDHLSVIVDSPTGSVTLCSLASGASSGVAYSREGSYAIAPLPGDAAVISDGATTQRLDAGGKTVAQVADGGEVAVDATGNVFVASIASATPTVATLSVRKYDPGLALAWTASVNLLAGSRIQSVATDAGGDVLVGAAAPADGSVTATRFSAGGAFVAELSAPGNAVGLDGDQALVAWNDSGTLRITRYNLDGSTVWSRGFTGRATITQIMADPQHRVLFGGELIDSMDFGGGALHLGSTPEGPVNGFVVLLSQAGDHVMSSRTEMTDVNGLGTNGENIAVSGLFRTQLHHLAIAQFGTNGRTFSTGFSTVGEELGEGGRIVVGPSGRLWWNLESNFPVFNEFPYLVVTQ